VIGINAHLAGFSSEDQRQKAQETWKLFRQQGIKRP
jgi:hypothetical protein